MGTSWSRSWEGSKSSVFKFWVELICWKNTHISRPFDAPINSISYLWQDLSFMIMISSHLTKIKTCPVRVYMYIYVHKAYTPVDLCRTSRLLPVSFPSPILTLTYCTPSHCQRKGLLIIDIIRHSLETGRIRLLYNNSLVLDGGIKKEAVGINIL